MLKIKRSRIFDALTPENHSFIIIHAAEFTLVDVPMADLIFITVERRPDTANAFHRKDGEHGTEYRK